MNTPNLSFNGQVEQWFERHLSGPEPLNERLRRLWSYRQSLYWQAVDMHREGQKHQYRQFGVGAAALAFRPDRFIWDGQAVAVCGYNSKELRHGPKCCAERRLFESAQQQGFTQVVGIIIVGPYQPDDVSGYACTTLHPCLECRTMMAAHPLAWTQMPIMTALPPPEEPVDWDKWEPTHEWHTLGQILKLHSTPT